MTDTLCTNCGKPESKHIDSIYGKMCSRKALSKTFSTAPKKLSDPLEKVIEGKVCDYAKSLGCLHYKFTSPARRSVPDRMFVMPAGKGVFFIEFKRLGQEPTPSQAVEIDKIRKQGIPVYVVDNVSSGKAFVDNALSALEGVKGGQVVTMDDF